MKKNYLLKTLSSLMMSACLLVGNAAPVFAEGEEDIIYQNSMFEVVYNSENALRGQEVILTPHLMDTEGNILNFEGVDVKLAAEKNPDWVTMDEQGRLVCVPDNKTIAKTHLITVLVRYSDESEEFAYGKLTVMNDIEEDAVYINKQVLVEYLPIEMEPGDEGSTSLVCKDITTQIPDSIPEGTTFKLDGNYPDWIKVDEQGVVSATPSKDAGEYVDNVLVQVTYVDGSSDLAIAPVIVTIPEEIDENSEGESTEPEDEVNPEDEKDPEDNNGEDEEDGEDEEGTLADLYDPSYPEKKVENNKGGRIEIFYAGEEPDVDDVYYSLDEDRPSWLSVGADGTLIIKNDEKSPGNYDGTVTITYLDDSVDEANYYITVLEERSMEITPKSLTVLVGEVAELNLDVNPIGSIDTESVSWSSKDESIATVNSQGLVTGMKPGKTTITAITDDGIKASSVVRVEGNIAVEPSTMKLEVGKTGKIVVKANPEGSVNLSKIMYTSDDERIATVSHKGLVTGIAEGTTTITVESAAGSKAVCTVTVGKEKKDIEVTKITLGRSSMKMGLGDTTRIDAYIYPENATIGREITWSTDDTSILSVDPNTGKFKGLKLGKANIIATTSNGKSASCEVRVLNKKDVDTGTKSNVMLYVGIAAVAIIALLALLFLGRKKK